MGKLIFENLFKEGVLVCKKDPYAPKHAEIDVPNLHVMKACQSLVSKGYLKEKFSWGYHYFTLTNEGIQFLREYLHLPTEIVPATTRTRTVMPTGVVTRKLMLVAEPATLNSEEDSDADVVPLSNKCNKFGLLWTSKKKILTFY